MKNTITILVAIIGAIATIAASIISAGNYAEDKTTNTLKLESAYAPVGTIVSSMLEPTEFARHMNETEGDELAKRKWVLADGRKVTGTEYARATKDKPLPDLRGVFLRGVDTGRTDDQGDPEKID